MGTLQGGHMQMIFLPEAIIIIQHTEGRGILEKEVITPAITTEKIMIEIWIISLLLFPGFVYLMFRGRIIHIFNIEIRVRQAAVPTIPSRSSRRGSVLTSRRQRRSSHDTGR